ncbi:MAG: FkbM family methyltransferase [Candidatus Pacebacteria bacterium]|nr:FkbM family methyltransferase [Candidatus Paceibacterota bacterium]
MNLNTLTHFLQKIFPRWIYLRLRPLAAVLLEYCNWKVEVLRIVDIDVKVYADFYFPNSELIEEIQGYFHHYVPKSGDTVIDAGAYSGIFTIVAAKLVGKNGKVIAYEPDPFNRRRLRRNILLNDLKNVVVRPFGLYSRNTILLFEVRQVASRIAENLERPIQVQMKSLDAEMKSLGLSKVHMVKMDIEGAEIEALKGASRMIRKSQQTLHWAIASYHIVNRKPTSLWLEKFFSKTKFSAVVTGNLRHKTTYAWMK